MYMYDIALNDTDDLEMQGGDFVADESTGTHQRQLLLNNKGDLKENPTICVGVQTYYDDEQLQNLARAVAIEFARDGMDVQSVRITQAGTLESEATY